MASYTVYIIRCKNGKLYTGIARDAVKRFELHKKGFGSKFMRANPPKKIVFMESKRNRSSAQKREAEIKKYTREEKLALIGNKQ